MYQGVINIEQRQHTTALHENQTVRKPKALYTGRTVLDIGVLTIDEVITAKGKRAYMFTARSQKRAYPADLKKAISCLLKELERIGERKVKGASYYREYRKLNGQRINEQRRTRYAATKTTYNQKRRERYAQQRQFQQQLARL